MTKGWRSHRGSATLAAMPTTLADLLPALDLRVTAGPIEMRGITDEDLPALVDLVRDGVHDPERMPFTFPWTDAPAAELPRLFAQYHWRCRVDFSPASWTINLAVRHEGALVGVQGLAASSYLVTRSGETGSWLGRRFQGQGIGTAMRQAMCAFVLDDLGAVEVRSGAFADNPSSLAVSRKVGYRRDGTERRERRPGELALLHRLALAPGDLVRGPHRVEVEGLVAFRRSIGLDSE